MQLVSENLSGEENFESYETSQPLTLMDQLETGDSNRILVFYANETSDIVQISGILKQIQVKIKEKSIHCIAIINRELARKK